MTYFCRVITRDWRVFALVWIFSLLLWSPVSEAGHFPQPVSSPYNCDFLGRFKIDGVDARPGDEVAFFDPQGVLSGLYVVQNPGEYGTVHGEHGTVIGTEFSPKEKLADPARFAKPQLPPGMDPGGHGGSHGYLTNELVRAILEGRDPLINVAWSLNMTVPGIVAHESAIFSVMVTLAAAAWIYCRPFSCRSFFARRGRCETHW